MPQSRPPMESYNYYWERPPPPPPAAPSHHRKNNPSFSSSLLDAITRSIDDSDSAGGEPERRRNAPGGAQDPTTRRNHYYYYSSSSSSACSSSFFSSSDTDTPIRIRPIRTSPALARSDRIRSNAPLEKPNETQKQLTSIKKKLRELRRSAGPGSPGGRLAGFLNSIFHPAGAAKPKKQQSPSSTNGSSSSASSSSCSRSCLSKTPSTRGSDGGGGKRSVRFCPVGVIVGEDCRPCGEKVVFARDLPAPSRKAALLQELMATEEREDYESDSSEDLFELENLGGIVGENNGGASFRDELPVYETTSLGINRAIARGLIV
ncbi:putative protein BIG GRAIN 1 [Iris pallida]|uniref:Uncharacterized protein n=1 Tax=Iris pallida TaxID=29817 RepID=A0AAX6G5U2_IRIPA|nr:putative protein BIG GRAIN 1 [Iris pallida]